ncbi:hypothetical protein M569_02455, partial [Genlisea aurea]
ILSVAGGGVADETGPAAIVVGSRPYRIHTVFSVECNNYFDWQTVGLVHSLRKAGQPGPITRLLSCNDEELKNYRGMDLAPTFVVPSMTVHPKTGDWYPGINKPAGVLYWVEHSADAENVDWVINLDADGIVRGPILPWEMGAARGVPTSAHYPPMIGCDNIVAKLHSKRLDICDKVGGFMIMHIDDLRAMAPLWLSKTEEMREDRALWNVNDTGDASGWISEMYGYSFAAAEVGLRHRIYHKWMFFPGQIPRKGVEPILLHYYVTITIGNWSFAKWDYHEDDIVYNCSKLFPEPPYPEEVMKMESKPRRIRMLLIILEFINTLNEALLLHHISRGCPEPEPSKYVSFLRSKEFAAMTKPVRLTPESLKHLQIDPNEKKK